MEESKRSLKELKEEWHSLKKDKKRGIRIQWFILLGGILGGSLIVWLLFLGKYQVGWTEILSMLGLTGLATFMRVNDKAINFLIEEIENEITKRLQ